MVLHKDIEVRDSKIAGKGLYAKAPIRAGTIVSGLAYGARCEQFAACMNSVELADYYRSIRAHCSTAAGIPVQSHRRFRRIQCMAKAAGRQMSTRS